VFSTKEEANARAIVIKEDHLSRYHYLDNASDRLFGDPNYYTEYQTDDDINRVYAQVFEYKWDQQSCDLCPHISVDVVQLSLSISRSQRRLMNRWAIVSSKNTYEPGLAARYDFQIITDVVVTKEEADARIIEIKNSHIATLYANNGITLTTPIPNEYVYQMYTGNFECEHHKYRPVLRLKRSIDAVEISLKGINDILALMKKE
jgi:hypothetical protein